MTKINSNINDSPANSNFDATPVKKSVSSPTNSPLKSIKRSTLGPAPPAKSDDFFEQIIRNLKNLSVNENEKEDPISPKEKDPLLAEFEEKRKKSPVKTDALRTEAKLFKTEREAKAWLAKQDRLQDRNTRLTNEAIASGTKAENLSQNFILELRDATGKLIGYYKEAKKVESTSSMEKLIWDWAGIFGVQSLFVPTKESIIQGKTTAINGEPWKREIEKTFLVPTKETEKKIVVDWETSRNREVLQHNPKTGALDLATTKEDYDSRKGSFQAVQKGVTLSSYLKKLRSKEPLEASPIERTSLLKATFAAYLFGMYDAHNNNILIDKHGRIKFFDNTRSFPNSNEFINWNQKIRPAFKCNLFTLDESLKELAPQEREMLKEELAKYQSHLAQFEAFMQNRTTKAKLKSLPPGWLDSEKALEAFKERIERLENALSNPEIKSCTDLIFACSASSKFLMALNFIRIATSKEGFLTSDNPREGLLQDKEKALKALNKESSLNELITAAQKHIPLYQLYNTCQDRTQSFNDLMEAIANKLQLNLVRDIPPKEYANEQEKYAREAVAVLFFINSKAELENKDLSTEYSSYLYAVKKLKDFEFIKKSPSDPTYKNIQDSLKDYCFGKPLLWINTHKRELSIYRFNAEGELTGDILDLATNLGSITIRSRLLSYDEFTLEFPDNQPLKDDYLSDSDEDV